MFCWHEVNFTSHILHRMFEELIYFNANDCVINFLLEQGDPYNLIWLSFSVTWESWFWRVGTFLFINNNPYNDIPGIWLKFQKRRYLIYCTPLVFVITIIRYIKRQKNGKPNNLTKSLGAGKLKGLNRIAEMGSGYQYLTGINLCLSNTLTHSLLLNWLPQPSQ